MFFLQIGAPFLVCLHFCLRLQQVFAWPLKPGQNLGRLAGQVSSPLQILLPAGVVLSAQAGQVELPWFGCAVPTGQAMHVTLPVEAENDPAAQGVHALLPLAAENDPAGQEVHVVLPADAENDPAAHGVHEELLAFENSPAGHFWQVSLPVWSA